MARLGSKYQRKVFLTFAVAGVGAILTEHMIKPKLKRKLRV